MIFTVPPTDFAPEFSCAALYVEWDGKILLCLRGPHKSRGANRWGVPAGGVEEGERPIDAAARELSEETGIVRSASDLTHVEDLFVRYPSELDFNYHIFHLKLNEEPVVAINDEHTEYRWATPGEIFTLPLVREQDNCFKRFFAHTKI